jgi:hypothetical protein
MSDRHWEWLHYSKYGTLSSFIFQKEGGHNGRMVLPIQSVPITTNVVSLNPTHGEVYWIQHYVIKFVSDLRKVVGFLHVLLQYNWRYSDIIEILLKVTLNSITLTLIYTCTTFSCQHAAVISCFALHSPLFN